MCVYVCAHRRARSRVYLGKGVVLLIGTALVHKEHVHLGPIHISLLEPTEGLCHRATRDGKGEGTILFNAFGCFFSHNLAQQLRYAVCILVHLYCTLSYETVRDGGRFIRGSRNHEP